jgi:DNA-binding MarR family transcriptional regulator
MKHKNLVELMDRLLTPPRLRIIRFLYKNQPKNISQIMRHLKISYKETFRYVCQLEEWGYIIKEKRNKEKCTPVYISFTKKGLELAELLGGRR